tara:strand:+ start:29 stop:493 length:465 start_codon:yes stop_codon:yes gene_type:complete
MQIVDSNQKKLKIHEIITMAVHDLDTEEVPMQTKLISIVKETSLERCEVVNVGNTVFIGHRGKGKDKTKMAGKSLNVDTSRNEIKNILEYFAYIQGQGITHYSSMFGDSDMIPSMRVVHKKLQDTDTELAVGRTKDDVYSLYVKFGQELLSERF